MNLVSVIIPAYNAEGYICEAIESVLSQTYQNWELIIVDDGSIDHTAEVIKPYLIDKRIKYFYQKNGKQGKARNLAIIKSKGTYIAFLDADDLWTSDKLDKQMDVFKNNNVDVVFAQGWHFKNGVNNTQEFNSPQGVQDPKVFLKDLLVSNPIKTLSVIVKSDAILNVGGFNEDSRVQNTEDYQLWLKLVDAEYLFFGMEERLFYYRVHPNQSTSDFSEIIIPKIWTLTSIKYRNISNNYVKSLAEKKIDDTIIRSLDTKSKAYLLALINLYRKPLNKYKKFIVCKTSLLIGQSFFKTIWYRFYHSSL